jgi:hypothetical protein
MLGNKLVILLDLENTIIDSWSNPIPLPKKIKFIKSQIALKYKRHPIFGIFSSAIDNEEEKIQAIRLTEQTVDINIISIFVPSFKDMLDYLPFKSNAFQKWEIMNLLGKQGLFYHYTKSYPGHDFILFDDTVEDEIILRENQKIETRRA